jgi:hypothetical protein
MTTEEIRKRLAMLGYTYNAKDEAMIEFCTGKVEEHIKAVTACAPIPGGLTHTAIDMVCGEFLRLKKSVGQLTEFTFEQVASNVKLGDTSVTFAADASPEAQFDAIVNYLISGHESDLYAYRKLVW